LAQAVQSYKEKANAYVKRLEEAEIALAKSSRGEAIGMLNWYSLDRFLTSGLQLAVLLQTPKSLTQRSSQDDKPPMSTYTPSSNACRSLSLA
jgi:hypothetical protein